MIIKKLFLAFLCAIAIAIVSLWSIAGQLVSPDRRPLQDYHKDWINHPSVHGIRLQSSMCDNGAVPCIFVSPSIESGPGKRGAIIRKQLGDQGIRLLPFGKTQGILLLLHGRNGRKEDLLPVAERFTAIGFKCVIPDLPAHGDSPSAHVYFSTTHFEQTIAENVLEDARNFFSDRYSPASIWGLSMGGAYAVNAVSRHPSTWHSMIIVSSFDSLEGVVQDKLSMLPALISSPILKLYTQMIYVRSGLVLNTVQPIQWAENISVPVMIAHGDRDQLISPSRGKRLLKSFRSQKKCWVDVPGADHNNILVTDMPLYARMGEWLITNN